MNIIEDINKAGRYLNYSNLIYSRGGYNNYNRGRGGGYNRRGRNNQGVGYHNYDAHTQYDQRSQYSDRYDVQSTHSYKCKIILDTNYSTNSSLF